MDRPNRQMIFYIPGIISLTILPIAFILFGYKELKERTLTVLPIYLADTNLPKKFPENYKDYNYSFPPKRNYLDINLTGDIKNDKIKLGFAQIRIKEILSQNDSSNGIHFKFGDSSQYWTFVKAVDILIAGKAKTYIPLDNDLWFYHFPPKPTSDSWICGTPDNEIVYIEPELSIWTKAIKWTSYVWKTSWEIISTFFAFIFLVLMTRRKNISS